MFLNPLSHNRLKNQLFGVDRFRDVNTSYNAPTSPTKVLLNSDIPND